MRRRGHTRPSCRRDNDLRRPGPEGGTGGAIDPSLPAALTHQAAGNEKSRALCAPSLAALSAARDNHEGPTRAIHEPACRPALDKGRRTTSTTPIDGRRHVARQRPRSVVAQRDLSVEHQLDRLARRHRAAVDLRQHAVDRFNCAGHLQVSELGHLAARPTRTAPDHQCPEPQQLCSSSSRRKKVSADLAVPHRTGRGPNRALGVTAGRSWSDLYRRCQIWTELLYL